MGNKVSYSRDEDFHVYLRFTYEENLRPFIPSEVIAIKWVVLLWNAFSQKESQRLLP